VVAIARALSGLHQDLLQPRTGRVIGHAGVDVELISSDEPFWF
jgi:hypothetical protein